MPSSSIDSLDKINSLNKSISSEISGLRAQSAKLTETVQACRKYYENPNLTEEEYSKALNDMTEKAATGIYDFSSQIKKTSDSFMQCMISQIQQVEKNAAELGAIELQISASQEIYARNCIGNLEPSSALHTSQNDKENEQSFVENLHDIPSKLKENRHKDLNLARLDTFGISFYDASKASQTLLHQKKKSLQVPTGKAHNRSHSSSFSKLRRISTSFSRLSLSKNKLSADGSSSAESSTQNLLMPSSTTAIKSKTSVDQFSMNTSSNYLGKFSSSDLNLPKPPTAPPTKSAEAIPVPPPPPEIGSSRGKSRAPVFGSSPDLSAPKESLSTRSDKPRKTYLNDKNAKKSAIEDTKIQSKNSIPPPPPAPSAAELLTGSVSKIDDNSAQQKAEISLGGNSAKIQLDKNIMPIPPPPKIPAPDIENYNAPEESTHENRSSLPPPSSRRTSKTLNSPAKIPPPVVGKLPPPPNFPSDSISGPPPPPSAIKDYIPPPSWPDSLQDLTVQEGQDNGSKPSHEEKP